MDEQLLTILKLCLLALLYDGRMRLPSAFVLGLALLSGCPTPEPTDGGPVDGGSDADTRCDVDADCDDRRACNGVETCVASQCM